MTNLSHINNKSVTLYNKRSKIPPACDLRIRVARALRLTVGFSTTYCVRAVTNFLFVCHKSVISV